MPASVGSEHLVIDWATVGAGLHLLRDGRSWKPNLAVAADGPWPQLSAGFAVWAPKYAGAESKKRRWAVMARREWSG